MFGERVKGQLPSPVSPCTSLILLVSISALSRYLNYTELNQEVDVDNKHICWMLRFFGLKSLWTITL